MSQLNYHTLSQTAQFEKEEDAHAWLKTVQKNLSEEGYTIDSMSLRRSQILDTPKTYKPTGKHYWSASLTAKLGKSMIYVNTDNHDSYDDMGI